jgi:hypothetical protein
MKRNGIENKWILDNEKVGRSEKDVNKDKTHLDIALRLK